MRSLVWFRRDLRVADNRALFNAAKHSNGGVIGVFVVTPQQWQQHDDADCKVRFWLDSLRSLSESLAERCIPLIIKTCDTYAGVPDQILAVAQKHNCTGLFFNREYEVNEARRDTIVAAQCQAAEMAVRRFHDRVIVPPLETKTKEGRFYSVFTPFRKVWATKALDLLEPLPKPSKQSELAIKPSTIPKKISGFDLTCLYGYQWKTGEAEAQKRLKKFVATMGSYDEYRNFPSIDGTSLLSPYLAAGAISPRQCLEAAVVINKGKIDGENPGATTWISELAWRDFYVHVMVGFPRVSMHRPFKLKTDSVAWRKCDNDFEAWKSGQTGYPIVDAGMRQLNQTGWMHNRLRMVTAMFLTKHLLIDWRWGERYFMQKLIDGDLAANNGGWQWSASTGTDSVPYFRIFNPFSQSKRFDPDGIFIKRFCPELDNVPAKSLHDAARLTKSVKELNLDYPVFIVDYKKGRERALTVFKEIS